MSDDSWPEKALYGNNLVWLCDLCGQPLRNDNHEINRREDAKYPHYCEVVNDACDTMSSLSISRPNRLYERPINQ